MEVDDENGPPSDDSRGNMLMITEVRSTSEFQGSPRMPIEADMASGTTDANIPITKVRESPRGDLRSAFVMETDDEDTSSMPSTSYAQRRAPVTYQPQGSPPEEDTETQDFEGSDQEESESAAYSIDTTEHRRQQEILDRYFNHELTFSEYAVLSGDLDADEAGQEADFSQPAEVTADPKGPGKGLPPKKGTRRKRRILPPALEGLMGEANLTYARGDFATAEKMCLEVIRQCPEDPTAFSTLAVLYEEQNLPEKSLQVALIAALLSPGDPNQWIRLAMLSEEQGNIKQAVHCYTKAIRADPSNIEAYMKKSSLLQSLNEHKNAIRCYSRLLTMLSSDKAALILDLAKEIADYYHKEGDIIKAVEAMEIAFKKVPKEINSEQVNLMLELLLQGKKYFRCLEILVGFCDVEVEFETGTMSDEPVEMTRLGGLVNCKWPDFMPIDIWVKLGLTLIHMKAFHLVDDFIHVMSNKLNCEEAGDLYLDMAEALMSEDRHKDALPLLEILVNSENYSLAAVWLRLAECLRACGRVEDAIAAYQQVVEQAPQHVDVRVTLATMLTSLRRDEQALNVLTQDADSEALDAGLLYKKCMLLRDGGKERHEEFLAVGQLLLSRHCVRIRNRDELDALCRLRRIDKKSTALKEIRSSRGEPDVDHDAPDFSENMSAPTVEEEWSLLKDMGLICLQEGRTGLLQRLAFSALGSPRFYNQALGLECEFFSLLASFYNSDAYHGYNLARDLIIRETDYPRAWNLFNLVLQRADDVRHNRFIMRCLTRHPNNSALGTLHANNCLVAGTYKYALNEYAASFRKEETPLLAFLLGVTLIQMACQKFSAKKNALVTQGVAFLWKYRSLRGPLGEQEAHYNFGRAFHQLGLLSAATHHYKQVLAFNSRLTEAHSYLDLKREAAFNLHLIYKTAGELDLAQRYIDEYIVI